MKEKKKHKHKVIVEGAISPNFIAESISKHASKTNIGAHDIFLGQVRADEIDSKIVTGIKFTCYEEMAEEKFSEIREQAFSKYDLTCMHIYHSIGEIKAGEICLFVFVSSKHRSMAFDACREVVESIKINVPIFGQEMFEDKTFVWKKNNI